MSQWDLHEETPSKGICLQSRDSCNESLLLVRNWESLEIGGACGLVLAPNHLPYLMSLESSWGWGYVLQSLCEIQQRRGGVGVGSSTLICSLNRGINSTFSVYRVGNLLTHCWLHYLWLKTSEGDKFKFHQVTHRKGMFPLSSFSLVLEHNHLESFLYTKTAVSHLVRLGCGPVICISDKFPGDAEAAGLRSFVISCYPKWYDQSYFKTKIIHVIPSLKAFCGPWLLFK